MVCFYERVEYSESMEFELGSQESMNVPLWIFIGFQQKDRQDSQNLKKYTFCRLPVISAQGIFETEKYPDDSILLNYDDDYYSHGYGQNNEASRALTKNDILQLFIRDTDFRSPNIRVDDVGYKYYVFDIRYQQNFQLSNQLK